MDIINIIIINILSTKAVNHIWLIWYDNMGNWPMESKYSTDTEKGKTERGVKGSSANERDKKAKMIQVWLKHDYTDYF